jgi:hypothetical protein
MQRLLLLALCALVWAPVAHTQTPHSTPQFFQMVVYRNLRPGYAAFMQRELNPAQIKGGLQSLSVWSTALGDLSELITLQPVEGAGDFFQFRVQGNAPATSAQWLRFTQFYEERLTYVIVTRPELSTQLPPVWPRLARLRITTTEPQRDDEFAQWVQRESLPRAAQNTAATEWFAKLRYGGDVNNTFLSWRVGERFSDLDAAFDRQADAQLLPVGVVTCNTDYWLRYRPDLSIVEGKVAPAR